MEMYHHDEDAIGRDEQNKTIIIRPNWAPTHTHTQLTPIVTCQTLCKEKVF